MTADAVLTTGVNDAASASAESRPAREPVAIELLLGALIAIAPLSIDMYLPALPTLARDLGIDDATAQLTLSAYFAGFALGQLASGPLLDRFGRRGPILVSLVLYVCGSIGCAFAPTAHALMAARFLQALGGAGAVVAPRTIVRDLLSGNDAARMMSRLILVMGVAPIVAPLLGGWVLAAFGWRAIFYVLSGFAAFVFVVIALRLPETSTVRRPVAETFAALRDLVSEHDFIAFTLCVAFAQAGLFAYLAGTSFVFIELHHIPAQQFGLFFGANAIGFVATSQINHVLLAKHSTLTVLRWGTRLGFGAALIVFAVGSTGAGGVWGISAALFCYIASLAIVMPNAVALAFEHHAPRAGLASAVMGATQFTIGATATVVISAVNDLTAVPMCAGILIAAALALAVATTRTPV